MPKKITPASPKQRTRAINAEAAKRQTPHELALRMGLIGAFNGAPDLSQNVASAVKQKLARKAEEDDRR